MISAAGVVLGNKIIKEIANFKKLIHESHSKKGIFEMAVFRKLLLFSILILPIFTFADDRTFITDINTYSIGLDVGAAIPMNSNTLFSLH